MLTIKYDHNKALKELEYYKRIPGNLNGPSSNNYIVKYYQQNVFFKEENELFNNPQIRNKLIENRCKYLNKEKSQLTDEDLLLGFKRSGIYYGYSHFNPLIFKYFINRYNVTKCYDPCGGWGHRLLGAQNLSLYIYNDLSYNIYNNVKKIVNDFNLTNTICFNEDAFFFNPQLEYDSMFTCPPYYNLETYECGKFETFEEYELLIDNIFRCFYNNEKCKYFGLVIRNDLLKDKYKTSYFECFEINNKKSKHLTKNIEHNNKEILYVYKK